jgi:hypothetical protein
MRRRATGRRGEGRVPDFRLGEFLSPLDQDLPNSVSALDPEGKTMELWDCDGQLSRVDR